MNTSSTATNLSHSERVATPHIFATCSLIARHDPLQALLRLPRIKLPFRVASSSASAVAPPTLRSSLARSTPKATSRSSLSRQTISQGGAVRHGMLHGCRRRLLAVNADDTSMFEDLELQLAAECSGRDLLGEAAVAIGSHAH